MKPTVNLRNILSDVRHNNSYFSNLSITIDLILGYTSSIFMGCCFFFFFLFILDFICPAAISSIVRYQTPT